MGCLGRLRPFESASCVMFGESADRLFHACLSGLVYGNVDLGNLNFAGRVLIVAAQRMLSHRSTVYSCFQSGSHRCRPMHIHQRAGLVTFRISQTGGALTTPDSLTEISDNSRAAARRDLCPAASDSNPASPGHWSRPRRCGNHALTDPCRTRHTVSGSPGHRRKACRQYPGCTCEIIRIQRVSTIQHTVPWMVFKRHGRPTAKACNNGSDARPNIVLYCLLSCVLRGKASA